MSRCARKAHRRPVSAGLVAPAWRGPAAGVIAGRLWLAGVLWDAGSLWAAQWVLVAGLAAPLPAYSAPAAGPGAAPAEGQEKHPDTVHLRGGERLPCRVMEAGPEGLLIERRQSDGGPGGRVRIGWDRVRRVDGPGATLWEPWGDFAERLWRARARLERGDVSAAWRDLEGVLGALAGRPELVAGPSGATLCEAVMRARLARGWRTGALWAWLAWRDRAWNAPRMDSWRGGGLEMRPAIDATTGLVPGLPPFVFEALPPGVAAGFATAEAPWLLRDAGARQREMLALYRAEAAARSGDAQRASALITDAVGPDAQPARPEGAPGVDPGLELVRSIVVARHGDQGQRRDARSRLEVARLRAMREGTRQGGADAPDAGTAAGAGVAGGAGGAGVGGAGGAGDLWLGQALGAGWIEAWALVGIGRSLIQEPDPAERRTGVLRLIEVASSYGAVQPDLARLALRLASEELARQGDAQGAARLLSALGPDPAEDPPDAELPTQPAPAAVPMRMPGLSPGGAAGATGAAGPGAGRPTGTNDPASSHTGPALRRPEETA